MDEGGTVEASRGEQRFVHEQRPYEPRFKRVNGWRMHYIDEGAGDPVGLVHGNPAWGFLYRKRSSQSELHFSNAPLLARHRIFATAPGTGIH